MLCIFSGGLLHWRLCFYIYGNKRKKPQTCLPIGWSAVKKNLKDFINYESLIINHFTINYFPNPFISERIEAGKNGSISWSKRTTGIMFCFMVALLPGKK